MQVIAGLPLTQQWQQCKWMVLVGGTLAGLPNVVRIAHASSLQ